MATYSFSKDPVTINILADEIVEAGLPASIGITHNPGQTPDDLHIEFSGTLDAAQQTTLGTTVTNHVADAPPVPAGIGARTPVRAATIAALPANTRSGDMIVADANGALPAQDGVTLVVNDRLLVKNEAAGADNGVYYVMAVGDGSNPWKLRRCMDANSNANVRACLNIFIEEGTVNGGQEYALSTANPITVNTTALTFGRVGGKIPQVDASGVVVWSARVSGDSNNRIQISADGTISWGPGNAAVDVTLTRDAPNTMAQRNGANAQAFHLYNTYTDGSNYERGRLVWTSNTLQLATQAAGTGTVRAMEIGTLGSTAVSFFTDSTFRFNISAAGHLLANTDNGPDVGGPSNRIRNVYVGTKIIVGTSEALIRSGTVEIFDSGTATITLRQTAVNNEIALLVGSGAGAVGTTSNDDFRLRTNDTDRWTVKAAGHIESMSDNTYDQGSASARIRSGYFGTSVSVGTNPSSAGGIRLGNTVSIHSRNFANDGNVAMISVDASDNVLLDGGNNGLVLSTSGGKMHFYGGTPIAQPSSTGQTAGFTAGAGTSVLDDSTFTGGVGTKAYTIGDLVAHIKNLGLVASS